MHDEWGGGHTAPLLHKEGGPGWSFLRVAVDQVTVIEIRTGRGYKKGGSGDEGLERKDQRACVSFIQQLL